MINMVVNSLDRLETIAEVVKDSGRRHVGYGVKAEHFDTVGNALIWTLGQGLGAGFTPEVKEGWIEAYGVLASTMKHGCLRLGVMRASLRTRASASSEVQSTLRSTR